MAEALGQRIGCRWCDFVSRLEGEPVTEEWLSVEAAIAAGRLEAISAVWYWPVHGSFLQATANLLRRAIERIGAEDPLRGVLKSVYSDRFWSDHTEAEYRLGCPAARA